MPTSQTQFSQDVIKPTLHQLGLERLEIESDRATEINVDVLERNRLEVPEVELLQQH